MVRRQPVNPIFYKQKTRPALRLTGYPKYCSVYAQTIMLVLGGQGVQDLQEKNPANPVDPVGNYLRPVFGLSDLAAGFLSALGAAVAFAVLAAFGSALAAGLTAALAAGLAAFGVVATAGLAAAG